MKKIILASTVAASLLVASSSYEITPMIGYVNTKDHVDIENHAVVGIGATRVLSNESKFSSLEIGLLQSGSADYENNMGDTKITQLFYNATKDYKLNNEIKLYALAGLGYERIATSKLGNESDPFFNYGVGAKYTFSNNFSLKLDARHQLKFDGDKNIVYLVGVAIPFGVKAEKVKTIVENKIVELDNDNDGIFNLQDKCPSTQAGISVDKNGCEVDSDNDGVVNSQDKCPSTPVGTKVNETGCAINLDADNDGILDTNDKCLKTPAGAKVDASGCEVLNEPVDLGIVFETNSDQIKSSDIVKFEKYVSYLNNVSTSKIIIEAHTDSVGDEKYNLQLSQRRAQSAKAQLISMGVDEERITATGYGETKPLVANDSSENMRKNRRVTARIEK